MAIFRSCSLRFAQARGNISMEYNVSWWQHGSTFIRDSIQLMVVHFQAIGNISNEYIIIRRHCSGYTFFQIYFDWNTFFGQTSINVIRHRPKFICWRSSYYSVCCLCDQTCSLVDTQSERMADGDFGQQKTIKQYITLSLFILEQGFTT